MPPPPVPPAPRSTPGTAAIAVVIVLVIIVIAVVVAILALLAHLVPDEAAPAPVTPTASESAPAEEGGESSAADPGTPAGTEGPEDASGSIPEYAFEELATHPLLAEGIGLPNLECDLAAPGETRSQIETHASDVIDCLDRMWEPALDAAEIEHRSPGLFVPESLDEISSPCGAGGADYLAFYCPTDEGIYLPVDLLGSPPEVMPHYYAWIVAHEYGHHVQYLSGIGRASDAEERARRVFSPGAREVLRRLEIQAECFAGMFLGSSDSAGNLAMSDHYHGFMEWTRTGGPSETHGSGEIQAQWWSAGYLSNRTASCNTYSAPAEDVAAE